MIIIPLLMIAWGVFISYRTVKLERKETKEFLKEFYK